jgi:ubiquinol-cytochrome c reductase iron-sulfur subunit
MFIVKGFANKRRFAISRRDFASWSVIAFALGIFGTKQAVAGRALSLPSDCEGDGRVLVDLDTIKSGKQLEVTWMGRPIFVRRRTEEEIAAARAVALSDLVDPELDSDRVKKPEWLVVVGKCTHIGCKPFEKLGDYGGWLCLCHASQFDTSGRVRSGPASRNLQVPPYRFIDKRTLEIGCE